MVWFVNLLLFFLLCGSLIDESFSSKGRVVVPVNITSKYVKYGTENSYYKKNEIVETSALILEFEDDNLSPSVYKDYAYSLHLSATNTVITPSENVIFNNTDSKINVFILRPTENYFGKITLMVLRGGAHEANITIDNYSTVPLVSIRKKADRISEGNDFNITCDVKGVENYQIEWRRPTEGNETKALVLDDAKRIQIIPKPSASTLYITAVNYNDSGHYFCVATVQGISVTASIELRVKDRLAPLWPFIGIVIEVIILVVAILFYENRRSKQAKANKESDQQRASPTAEDQVALKAEDNGENDAETRLRPVKA